MVHRAGQGREAGRRRVQSISCGARQGWIADEPSPVLELPSAVIPAENIFLLNPQHSAFAKIEIGDALDFEFDLRLISRL